VPLRIAEEDRHLVEGLVGVEEPQGKIEDTSEVQAVSPTEGGVRHELIEELSGQADDKEVKKDSKRGEVDKK
jgi:hypothetical protein